MSDDQIDRRDYGRLEAQVEQLTKDVHAGTNCTFIFGFAASSSGNSRNLARPH